MSSSDSSKHSSSSSAAASVVVVCSGMYLLPIGVVCVGVPLVYTYILQMVMWEATANKHNNH